MDLVSILLLGLAFSAFFALIQFCDAVVREQEGRGNDRVAADCGWTLLYLGHALLYPEKY